MAFTGSFTLTQLSSDLTGFTLTDTSSYADEAQGTFSGRRIYNIKVDGNTLVPDGTSTSYIDWPFTDGNTKAITGILNTDYALLVEVQWISLAPQPGSTYTASDIYGFLNYLKQFYSGQISNLSDDPNILNNTNWYDSLSKLQTEIDNAEKAVSDGQQLSAQNAISRATYLMNNSQFFF